jgi:hypothetical protein
LSEVSINPINIPEIILTTNKIQNCNDKFFMISQKFQEYKVTNFISFQVFEKYQMLLSSD